MTRRIAWFAGFGIAVMVALLMRSLDSDWLATVSTALIFIVLPDMFLNGRRSRRPSGCRALKSKPDILITRPAGPDAPGVASTDH
jgi:hypothetical protein